jgi:hypothetical protein
MQSIEKHDIASAMVKRKVGGAPSLAVEKKRPFPLYLGRKRMLGAVEDVEGLEAVLWLRGIEQWRSGLGDLLGGGRCLLQSPFGSERETVKRNGERERE